MEILLVVLAVIKLLKVISVYATYELLKNSNPLTILIALKFTALLIMVPLQKPFNGPKLKITEEQLNLLKMVENVNNQMPSHESSGNIPQRDWLFWMVYISTMHVIDFYMTSLVSGRLGSQSVTRLAKLTVVITSLIFRFLFWSSSDSVEQFVSVDRNEILVNSFLLKHQMSVGVIVSVVCILYASDLLTADKSGHGPEGISSGHFIGYSMAGLPLFTAGQTPTHGTALLANSEEFGLWYHLRATFHGILTGQASRRIFAFLCLNLAFTFVELFYGVWTNSLGLISDGFHMLFDSAALVVGLYAAVVSHWKPTRIFSFGYNSAEILSGLVNALFLLVISGSVFINSIVRIHQPPDIKTDKLLAVSILGLLVNIVGVVALGHAHSHGGHGHSHGGHGHSHSGSHGHNHGGSSSGQCHNHEHGHSHSRNHSDSSNRSHSHHHDLKHAVEAHNEELHYGHTHGHQHHCGSHKSQKDEAGDANLRGVYLHVLADTLGSVSVIFSSFLVTNYGWNVADPICSMFIACVIGYSAMPLLNDTLCLLTLKVPDEFHSQLMVKKIKELIQNHFTSISHLTIQIEKEEYEYHTQAMGLHLSVIGHYPKSFINSNVLMNGLTHHHHHDNTNHCGKYNCSSERMNLLSVKDI
uniref:Proton-coupled zinc antiporter SLC30A5 n=1 Tax=Schistosoma haematobium TaxID=6185 RepID=A0A094ZP50_SCHHA